MYDHTEHVKAYKEALAKKICDYMQMPVNDRSAEAICKMLKTMEKVEKYLSPAAVERLSADCLKKWNEHMMNSDGSTGGHWTVAETTNVANSVGVYFEHITDLEWNATMNMVYSDYCMVARKNGVDTAGFYADLSKAFLFDRDGGKPSVKLAEYYHAIVVPAMA